MITLLVSLGAVSGLVLGWFVWFGADRFTARYRDPALTLPPADEAVLPGDAGAVSPGAALTIAGMTLWGGWVGWQTQSLAVSTSALLVTAVLLCLSLVDLRVRRIPNELALALLALAIVQMIWLGRPSLSMAALGLVVAGGFFFLVALLTRSAMGMGDVKLEAAIGALLGYPAVLAAIVAGVFAGGIAAAFLLITKRAGRKDPFAYGPYLALGAWIVLVQAWGLWPL